MGDFDLFKVKVINRYSSFIEKGLTLANWRRLFFQSVHSGVFGEGSNFAIFSANRGWPLQLL